MGSPKRLTRAAAPRLVGAKLNNGHHRPTSAKCAQQPSPEPLELGLFELPGDLWVQVNLHLLFIDIAQCVVRLEQGSSRLIAFRRVHGITGLVVGPTLFRVLSLAGGSGRGGGWMKQEGPA